jgi:hypothetical protein
MMRGNQPEQSAAKRTAAVRGRGIAWNGVGWGVSMEASRYRWLTASGGHVQQTVAGMTIERKRRIQSLQQPVPCSARNRLENRLPAASAPIPAVVSWTRDSARAQPREGTINNELTRATSRVSANVSGHAAKRATKAGFDWWSNYRTT